MPASEFEPAGPVLGAFHRSDALIRAILGPMLSGKRTSCANEIALKAAAQTLALSRGKDDPPSRMRWAVIQATREELVEETLPAWDKVFSRPSQPGADDGVGRWDHKTMCHEFKPWRGLIMDVVFLGLNRDADRQRLLTLKACGVWLVNARDLPEDILDRAIRITAGWREPTTRLRAPWQGVIISSRMAPEDHWLKRRSDNGDVTLFRQPSGLSPEAENPTGFDYQAEARGLTPDLRSSEIEAEWSAPQFVAQADTTGEDLLWERLGALDGSEDQGEPSQGRLKAIAEYRQTLREATDLRGAARDLAKTDLFFIFAIVLGRADANRDWLFDRCREVGAGPNGYLDLWAREHYKSSIQTFAKTIQDILGDPELTVGIFSFNRPVAKAFLRQIKREFEGNKLLHWLFPDILWDNPWRDAPKWSEDDGIIVRRRGNPKESTIEAWGLIDGQPTSKHYRLMIYDDVVTRDSVTSPEMVRKVTDAWEVSTNLGSEGGYKRYIGTRWAIHDTYRTILDRGAAIERRHAATANGKPEGDPVLLSRESLAEKRKAQGPYTFGAQMLLDPTSDKTQGFKEEWLRFYRKLDEGAVERMNKYLLVDPASKKKKSSDYTTMGVIGLSDDGNYYLLDGLRDRLSLTERGRHLFRLHRRWNPKQVGYEEYGLQADIEYFKERMEDESYRFEITELGGQIAKEDRIRRLIPTFEGHRFYLPEAMNRTNYEGIVVDIVATFISDEYLPFPVAVHDDFFDMLSRITDAQIELSWPRPDERPRRARPMAANYNALTAFDEERQTGMSASYNPYALNDNRMMRA